MLIMPNGAEADAPHFAILTGHTPHAPFSSPRRGGLSPRIRAGPFCYCERRAPEALRGRGATRSTDEASTFAVALPVMMSRSAMSGMKGLVWPKVPLPFIRTIWVGA